MPDFLRIMLSIVVKYDLNSVQCSGACRELISVHVQMLPPGDLQITPRRVLLAIEGNVLIVSHTATGQSDRQVSVVVRVRVPHVASVQDHSPIE